MREKKYKLDEINQEFQAGIRNGAELLYDSMSDFIDGKVDNSKFNEVIVNEKRCDRLKEKYIQLLFKSKRALPFLIEDRYKIITYLDKISNMSEFIARYMLVYPYKFDPEIKENMNELNRLYLEIIVQLINITLLMETNFNAAYQITFEVENLRRKAHNLKFVILGKLFKKTDDPFKVNLTWKIISLIYDVISWVEEISDYLRGLIIKYPRR